MFTNDKTRISFPINFRYERTRHPSNIICKGCYIQEVFDQSRKQKRIWVQLWLLGPELDARWVGSRESPKIKPKMFWNEIPKGFKTFYVFCYGMDIRSFYIVYRPNVVSFCPYLCVNYCFWSDIFTCIFNSWCQYNIMSRFW